MDDPIQKIKMYETTHPERRDLGWRWFEVGVAPGSLTKLVADGKLEIVERRAKGYFYRSSQVREGEAAQLS